MADVANNSIQFRQMIGMGYNSLSNGQLSQALTVNQVNANFAATTNALQSTCSIVSSSSDFSSFTSNSVSASVGVSAGPLSVSASVSTKSSSFVQTTQNQYSLVIMEVFNGGYVMSNPDPSFENLTVSAAALATPAQKATFAKNYGNCFVNKAFVGGVLMLQYTAKLQTNKTGNTSTLQAALQATYGVLTAQANASLTQSQTAELSNWNITSNLVVVGNGYSGPFSVTTQSQMQQALNAFTTCMQNKTNWVAIAQTYADYSTAVSGSYTFPAFVNYAGNAVNNLTYTPIDANNLQLSWYSPPIVNGITCIDHYQISYFDASQMTVPVILTTITAGTQANMTYNFAMPQQEQGKLFTITVTPICQTYPGTCCALASYGLTSGSPCICIPPMNIVNNLSYKSIDANTINLTWNSIENATVNAVNVTYIDHYNVYYSTNGMVSPALLTTTPLVANNTQTYTFTIPSAVQGSIFYAWVIPICKGVTGACNAVATYGLPANSPEICILPMTNITWFNSPRPFMDDNMFSNSTINGFTNQGTRFLLSSVQNVMTPTPIYEDSIITNVTTVYPMKAIGKHYFFNNAGFNGLTSSPGKLLGFAYKTQISGTVPLYAYVNLTRSVYMLGRGDDDGVFINNGWHREWPTQPPYGYVFPIGSTITAAQLQQITTTGWFEIVSQANPNLCVDADNKSGLTNGSNIQVYTYAGSSNQQWQFQYASDGTCIIVSRANPSLLLNVNNYGGIANGSNVQLWQSGGQSNEKWAINNITNSSAIISSLANNNLLLNVNDSTTIANGSNVQVWQSGGQSNEYWKFVQIQ